MVRGRERQRLRRGNDGCLAEYFAKVPRAQCRRTMVFLGSAGHHNSTETTGHATARSNVSGTWLVDNRVGRFAKTALFINAEHTSTLSTFVQLGANRVRRHLMAFIWLRRSHGGKPSLRDLKSLLRMAGVRIVQNLRRSALAGDRQRAKIPSSFRQPHLGRGALTVFLRHPVCPDCGRTCRAADARPFGRLREGDNP